MKQKTKEFCVDWDSLEEVRQLFNESKSRFHELKRLVSGQPSRKERFKAVKRACDAIMATDISDLYRTVYLRSNPVYYVYAHLDCRRPLLEKSNPVLDFAASLGMDYAPFYIGKGTGERCYEMRRSETHAKTCQVIREIGKEVKVFKIADRLSEQEALCMEAKLIDIFGLVPHGGWLTNLDEGVRSEQRREMYGVHMAAIRSINKRRIASQRPI